MHVAIEYFSTELRTTSRGPAVHSARWTENVISLVESEHVTNKTRREQKTLSNIINRKTEEKIYFFSNI